MTVLTDLIFPSCVFIHLLVVAFAISNTEFKTILHGRCEEYQRIFYKLDTLENCQIASASFLDIFNVESAACKRTSYENFIKSVQHPVPMNKGLLWSGVKEFVEQIALSGKRYMPITFTLTGYMLDDIEICGDAMKDSAGCRKCNQSIANRAFWEMASEYYAKSLSGHVIVLLSARIVNGIESIYYDGSILATTEIPNLSPKIKSIEVWPIQALDIKPAERIKEMCKRPSVIKLKEIIETSKRLYQCVEDSKIPTFAMCLNEPSLCKMPTIVNGQKHIESALFPLLSVLTVSLAHLAV